MKYLLVLIVLFCNNTCLIAQTGSYKAITTPVQVPYNLYLTMDSTKKYKIEDLPYSIFSNASVPAEKAFSLADKNKDKVVTYKEFTNALSKDLFYISLDVLEIKYYLYYLDENNDGYITDESRISFIDSAISMVESIDHKKYSYDCDAPGYDQNMKIRKSGRCSKDNKLSISELRNACLEKKLWVGTRLYWKY